MVMPRQTEISTNKLDRPKYATHDHHNK